MYKNYLPPQFFPQNPNIPNNFAPQIPNFQPNFQQNVEFKPISNKQSQKTGKGLAGKNKPVVSNQKVSVPSRPEYKEKNKYEWQNEKMTAGPQTQNAQEGYKMVKVFIQFRIVNNYSRNAEFQFVNLFTDFTFENFEKINSEKSFAKSGKVFELNPPDIEDCYFYMLDDCEDDRAIY